MGVPKRRLSIFRVSSLAPFLVSSLSVSLGVACTRGGPPALFSAISPATDGAQIALPLVRPIRSLDPAVEINEVTPNLFETLLEEDLVTHELHPRLAVALPRREKDRLVFTIRDDVVFHDGHRLEAQDFLTSWRRLKPSDRPGPDGTAPNARTLILRMRDPARLADLKTAVVSPKALKKFGAEFGEHPVGTGPFRLEAWIPRAKVILVKDHLRLTYFEIADRHVIWLNFLKGALDLAYLPTASGKPAHANPAAHLADPVRADLALEMAVIRKGDLVYRDWITGAGPAELRAGRLRNAQLNAVRKAGWRPNF